MDFQHFSKMASSAIDIDKSKISKMSEIDMANSGSRELITGFSTPPSSSLDNCDSGFNDLYSNNFSLLSSGNMKCAHTTPAQTDQLVDSSPESAQLFDDNSIAANDSENQMINSVDDEQVEPSVDTFKNTENNDGLMANKSNKNNVDYNARNDEIDDYNDDSNMSDISDLSDVFKLNADILPDMQRSIDWIHMQIASGVNPRDCLSRIFVNSPKQTIPENVSDNDLWRVIAAILSNPPRRQRLQHVQTMEQVCETIKKSQNIIVLTGAGVSVSCGIPDFRSRDGIYERLRVEYPDMRDPQSMFDIGYFARDPRPFYQFAKEIYPGQFKPSLSHRFIKLLERKGKLLRNYTQNIDTLERVAGIENVIECHGSFATASCTRCKHKVEAIDIQEDILHQRIPMCKLCESTDSTKQSNLRTTETDTDSEIELTETQQDTITLGPRPEHPFNYNQLVAAGVMKPDIVFFGESLPDKFHSMIELDKTKCDLLIVIGSSLKVRPVALIPSSINSSIPQILINREQLDHFVFDVELLGDSDVIINTLCHMLGEDWNDICSQPELKQTNELQMNDQIHSNIHNIPPLLANAVIKKPQESSIQCASDENQTIANINDATNSVSNYSIDHQQQPIESTSSSPSSSSSSSISPTNDKSTSNDTSFSTMANYLPDRTFFYNEKYSYIFPGAEIWWKDSDLDSNSSDSSNDDDDDDDDDLLKEEPPSDNGIENGDDIDDMEIEMATIDRNEMIDDVEQTIAVENLIETTTEHEFNKYLLKRSADTSLEEEVEIAISETTATTATTTTATNELKKNCSKRLRAQTDFELDNVLTSSCDSNSSSTNTSCASNQSDLYEI